MLRHVAEKMGGLNSSHLWRISMGFDGYLASIATEVTRRVGRKTPKGSEFSKGICLPKMAENIIRSIQVKDL